MLCRQAWVGLCLLGMGALAHAAPPAAPLRADQGVRVLGAAEVSLLRDPTGQLQPEQVRAASMASRFQPLSGGLNLGYSNDVIWLRIALARQSQAPVHWLLELTSAVINDVRFFSADAAGALTSVQAGDRYPFDERQVRYRRPVFELALPGPETQVFYLRLHSDSALTSQLVLWQPKAFEELLQIDALWIGSLLGIIILSMLFFLYTWGLIRDKLLLAALGLTASFALAALANLGLLHQYLLPQRPELADALHPVSMALFFPLLCLLLGRALNFAAVSRRLVQLQLPVPVLCASALGLRYFDLYAPFGGLVLMAGILYSLGWITTGAWWVWQAQRRNLITALVLSASSAVFAGAPLTVMGLLPAARYWELFWALGCAGFLLLAQMSTLDEVRKVRALRRTAQREQALRQQQALYFAGVAHDLRTPLGAVRTGVSNVRRLLRQDPDQALRVTERLQASAVRASDMIERHLQLQQIDRPDFELLREPTDLAVCLQRVQALVTDAWPDRDFQVTLAEQVPAWVLMDEEMVVRALINLLANAARASQAPAPIELVVDLPSQGQLRFEVRDSGPGLAQGLTLPDLLLVHWKRSRRATSRAGTSGFGIGLPMVGRIAALHGGALDYRRQAGLTVFSFCLPLAAAPA